MSRLFSFKKMRDLRKLKEKILLKNRMIIKYKFKNKQSHKNQINVLKQFKYNKNSALLKLKKYKLKRNN